MNSSGNKLVNIIKEGFDLDLIQVDQINGYSNRNFRITDSSGTMYVLKEFPLNLFNRKLYTSECEILQQLSFGFPETYQRPLETKNGGFLYETESDHKPVINFILTWLEGDFLAESPYSPELFRSLGRTIAIMDGELMKLDSIVIKARQIEWDLQNLLCLKNKTKYISDPTLRSHIQYYFNQFSQFVLPELPQLRKSIIHNDINDWNVLVKNGQVSGIIDFGDMVYAPIIQELAVAITYAMFEKEDPLEWATHVIAGYHSELPIDEKELELLYYLIAARLCMSIVHSAEGIDNNPGNEYLLVSQKPAMDLLGKWIAISPDCVERSFKEAVGYKVPGRVNMTYELEKRNRHISKSMSVSYFRPVKMKRAAFQYMFDADGNTFLDAYNNIPHVGHQHPMVVEAGVRQMALLNTNTRYVYDQLHTYAEKLITKFPDPLSKVFFVNSGSAASDLAIRMARSHTRAKNIVVMEHGYHGHTQLGLDISHYKFGRTGGQGQKKYILKAPIPDTYRGEFRNETAGVRYADQLSELLIQTNVQYAAFVSEPLVGCGGQVPLAHGYLKKVYPVIRNQGGVCISDEVQTGFGRLGTHFWGFETQSVVPDIVVLGKPMGNGHPMGAVVTSNEIAESFDNGMEFFSSFGGNPVSCEIGMAVLDVLEEEQLQQNALKTGNYFINLLKDLQDQFPVIGDVRGSGLFLGIEFVNDPVTMEPDTKLAQFLKNRLRENFILVSTDGPYDNVIKMKPPMCFNKKNASEVVEKMYDVLNSQKSQSVL